MPQDLSLTGEQPSDQTFGGSWVVGPALVCASFLLLVSIFLFVGQTRDGPGPREQAAVECAASMSSEDRFVRVPGNRFALAPAFRSCVASPWKRYPHLPWLLDALGSAGVGLTFWLLAPRRPARPRDRR